MFTPIPFASIFNYISTLVSAGCAIAIWLRREKLGKQNIFVSKFFLVFVLATVNMFVLGIPGTLSHNGATIQIVYTIGGILSEMISSYLAYIALAIFFPERQKLFSIIALVPVTLFIVCNIIDIPKFKPAKEVIIGPFVDWQGPALNPVTNIITMLMVAFLFLLFVVLFVVKGWWHKDRSVRRRSYYIATGMFSVVIGWSSAQIFIFLPLSPDNFLLLSGTVGGFFACLGVILLFIGITKEVKTEEIGPGFSSIR